MPIPQFATRVCVLLLALSAAPGCSNLPFKRPATVTPVSLVPPPGVATPAAMLPQVSSSPSLPSYADIDGRQLQNILGLRGSFHEAQKQVVGGNKLIFHRQCLGGRSLKDRDGIYGGLWLRAACYLGQV